MTDNDLIIPSCLFALKERKKIPLKSDWPKIIRIPDNKRVTISAVQVVHIAHTSRV